MATPSRPRIGGHVLADALVAQGIDHVFAVPGESYLDVLDGLYDGRQKLQLVTCRFEAGAVAHGGGVRQAHRPAGRGVRDARARRLPRLDRRARGDAGLARRCCCSSARSRSAIPTARAFQEVDYRRMFAPLAKWVTQIDHAARIPELVAHAVDVATSGRPGPVVIALSEEMQKDRSRCPICRGAGLARRIPIRRRCADAARCWRRPAPAAGGARRILLERGRAGGASPSSCRQRHAGDGRLPPAGAVRRHAGEFCRRSGRWLRSRRWWRRSRRPI